MTFQEIKDAVDKGMTVHWAKQQYTVVKEDGEYYVLNAADGDKAPIELGGNLIFEEHLFYCVEFGALVKKAKIAAKFAAACAIIYAIAWLYF
ncbi:MAG: hypothetical protein ABJI96_08020 [Paracoccaceae bacterium]